MKNRMKKISILILIILLFFTACKGKKSIGNDLVNSVTKSKNSDLQKDGELTPDSVVITVGDEAVTYKEALIYIYQLKEEYEPNLGENIWSFDTGNGITLEAYAKNQVIDNLIKLKTICQEAKRQEITLTDDEIMEISNMATSYLENITIEDQTKYGITKELIQKVYEDNQLASKMFDISTNDVDTDISDEEAKQIKIQYLTILTNGQDKNNNTIKMDKKQSEKAYQKIKELRKTAKQVENFQRFAETNSDSKETEIIFGEDDKPAEFGEEALKMKTGKLSKVIKGDSGYYILYCVNDFDKDATMAKKEEIILEQQNKEFEEKYKEWEKDYKIAISTTLWEQIKLVQ